MALDSLLLKPENRTRVLESICWKLELKHNLFDTNVILSTDVQNRRVCACVRVCMCVCVCTCVFVVMRTLEIINIHRTGSDLITCTRAIIDTYNGHTAELIIHLINPGICLASNGPTRPLARGASSKMDRPMSQYRATK